MRHFDLREEVLHGKRSDAESVMLFGTFKAEKPCITRVFDDCRCSEIVDFSPRFLPIFQKSFCISAVLRANRKVEGAYCSFVIFVPIRKVRGLFKKQILFSPARLTFGTPLSKEDEGTEKREPKTP